MIKHILKMLWMQKNTYYGIFAEQLLITIILMLSVVSVAELVQKYRSPGLLDVNNTFKIGYQFSLAKQSDPEAMENVQQNMKVIIEHLRNIPFVEAVSTSNNLLPYMRPDDNYDMLSDSILIDDNKFKMILKISDKFGASVLKPEIEEGSWLENQAMPDGSVPVVITRQFAEKAGWTNAVGKKLAFNNLSCTVVGVVTGLKQQSFDPSPVAMVAPKYIADEKQWFPAWYSENSVRIKAGYQAEFNEAFNREFRRAVSDKDVEPLVYDVHFLKKMFMSGATLELILQSVPTLFLFIFAFIGTFGLSWMVSRKRLKEFALRIAMGSTPQQLMIIVVGESLLVSCIAVIPALLLSFFIYDYTPVHAIGVGITACIMLLFSFISAWYPAWKVSRVNPAEALQYE
jgi:ABC-type antimicrobial peptide transport system permease subunit